MRSIERKHTGAELGQAAIELLVALPIALFVLTLGWQVVVAGHAWWTLSESARVAARTAYVKSEGDKLRLDDPVVRDAAERFADNALSGQLRKGHKTTVDAAGAVSVTARLPLAAPLAAVIDRGPRITARAGIAR